MCHLFKKQQLQPIANVLGILEIPYDSITEKAQWDKDFPLIRDASKCIRCIQICDKVQGLGIWSLIGSGYRTTVNVGGNRSIREADWAILEN